MDEPGTAQEISGTVREPAELAEMATLIGELLGKALTAEAVST